MTRIYLIRHGEAEGNIYRRAQGQYESELSAKGERQVAALAERFREEKIDALYSSDLRRTQKTAGAITKYHDLPLHLDARLRELALGAWEDVPFGDLEWRYGEQMDYFNNDPERWHAEGAESFAQLKARMRAVIDELAEKHAGETVVCCSHGMAIRALLSDILTANFGSDEFFINKAIGWSLRDYGQYDPRWVSRIIDRHKDKMSRLSIREGSKYLPAGQTASKPHTGDPTTSAPLPQ